MTLETASASVPGKVLLVGGYLVLDRLPSLVVATDSRVKCNLTASANDRPTIRVKSPQFLNAEWTFEWNGFKTRQTNDTTKNKFVQTTIDVVLAAATSIGKWRGNESIEVEILAHNDFYSQRDNV
jgi:phosphomevalonate kinase